MSDYTPTGNPATDADGVSADMRTEFGLIQTAVNSKTNASGTLAQFAATTSAQLAGVISDETGSGALVFGTSPTLVTPALGTPASGVLTNCTGTAAGLTAGNVTTNANLTGPITSTGNATAVAAQTGTGTTFVMQASPTLTTPTIGVATATSVNKVAITAPVTSATLTIADGKTLTASNTLTLTATDGSTLAIGAGGTLGTSAYITLGTGVGTALAVNVGTAGAFVVNGGALGSPSSAGTIPAFTLGGTVSGGGNQLNNVIIGTSNPLAGAFTTLSATSDITSSTKFVSNATSGQVFNAASATTGAIWGHWLNTSGDGYVGIEGSAGGAIATGTTPYAMVVGQFVNKPVQIISNNSVIATYTASGNVGIGTTAPDKAVEINSATGANLRLTYNDANGSAANYADFSTSSSGDLTIAPSGGDTNITGALNVSGDVILSKTITAPGTTGAQTINKSTGRVNFAAAATSLVVTNSLATANSIINATAATNDATGYVKSVVAAAGSFTIYVVAPTAEMAVNFSVTN